MADRATPYRAADDDGQNHQPRDWERLFRELAEAVEDCDQKAIQHVGEDDFVRGYLLSTGPWHRVLAKARAW